jgi:long-chain acyl-CoA synthetase
MDFQTLNQLLARAAETHRKPDALRYKSGGTWHSISLETWLGRARSIAVGLHDIGVRKGDRVALLSENRHEWFLVDSAMQILGAVNVPIYATLTPPQIAYIINDCEAVMVIASDDVQQKKIAEVRGQLRSVQHYLTIDPPSALEGTTLESVEKTGAERLSQNDNLATELASRVEAGDLASIIYTSGTTGDPKGVMLTHDNLVSNVKASLEVLPITSSDIALSALPYSHVFERMVAQYLYPAAGVSIAIAESVEALVDNMGEIQPTFVTMVPRFYEKMRARVLESVEAGSPLKKKIFRWGLAVGREHGEFRLRGESAPAGLELKYKIATALVFKKLQQRLGGRLRYFVSGGAPLPRDIAEFFWAAGIAILEGYGLTETSPVICVNRADRIRFGTVGPPIPGVEVKIASDGEVLARGPNIMKGYYKKEAETREAIDDQKFFHTGDVGKIDSEGCLSITDRKKDIIVTAGGKNIAPQPIEGRLKTNPFITEVVIIGNRRPFPSALVVPDFDKLTEWCRENSVSSERREDLVREPKCREFMLNQIASMTEDLAQFERVKSVTLLDRDFTLEGGELTPTMKVRRSVIEERYKALIDEMYASASDSPPDSESMAG